MLYLRVMKGVFFYSSEDADAARSGPKSDLVRCPVCGSPLFRRLGVDGRAEISIYCRHCKKIHCIRLETF